MGCARTFCAADWLPRNVQSTQSRFVPGHMGHEHGESFRSGNPVRQADIVSHLVYIFLSFISHRSRSSLPQPMTLLMRL